MTRGVESEYKTALTADYLRSIVSYDPHTGKFHAKVTKYKWVAGDELGYLRPDGYRAFMINWRKFLCHRLAWLYVHGEWPKRRLDHVNRNKSDNRMANLRPATNSQNGVNRNMNSNNTSGVHGVCWDKNAKLWMAKIQVQRKCINLGRFASIEDAERVRRDAETKYYGEFARAA